MKVRLCALILAAIPAAAVPAQPAPVQVENATGAAASGRLIVFARPITDGEPLPQSVDASPYEPEGTAVAAREIVHFPDGRLAALDGETDSFPTAFSSLPPGRYAFQAVLDRNHNYAYRGRGEGDLLTPVVEGRLPDTLPLLRLTETVPPRDWSQVAAGLPPEDRAVYLKAFEEARRIEFPSSSLSDFWGRPVHMGAWVVLPPGYEDDPLKTYPVLYFASGFTSSMTTLHFDAATQGWWMARGKTPPMIWVFLDHSSPLGPHQFADSANNGPWGTALVTELIPHLESRYRMDAQPQGRLLTGHSTGGWEMLWTFVNNPGFFGSVWSTAPDPVDFHSFMNVDLYSAENMYVASDDSFVPAVRHQGAVLALRDVARLEAVLGSHGGQIAALEAAFSPRGPDGRPMPLFDRVTGRIDPGVAARWRDGYDIARFIEREWPRIRSDMVGKINIAVGTADEFYLDRPVQLLETELTRLGARATIRYAEGRTHFDLYNEKGFNELLADIAWDAYAVGRPGTQRPGAIEGR